MNRRLLLRAGGFLAALMMLVVAAGVGSASAHSSRRPDAGQIVVANRGSGDLSVIDATSHDVTQVGLPDGSAGPSEPMYVNHWRRGDKVFVGDRANDRVLVLDDETFETIDEISVGAGAGVFHQWIGPRGRQLWVVGDVANTVTVIDPASHQVQATIDIPTDLTEAGGKPHDVFVSGRHAFVSIVGLDVGIVLRYDSRTFQETHRVEVAGDPHLFVRGNRLYVPQQDGSKVSLFNVWDLRPIRDADVPAAHGVWVTKNGRVLTTNIAGGGSDAVYLLNRSLRKVHDTVNTAVPTPHNITVDAAERQAFVTHSGAAANQVSIIDLRGRHFGSTSTVTVGTNPFGLGLVR